MVNVTISSKAYNILKNEAMHAVEKYGKMIEFAGILYGKITEDEIHISNIERLPEELIMTERTFRQKAMMIPTAGDIATPEINDYVSKRQGIIGFYHTHPFVSATLTGGDKEQLMKMDEFPSLAGLNVIHVISRLKGMGVRKQPEEPVFYLLSGGFEYVKVQPEIVESGKKIDIVGEQHFTNVLFSLIGHFEAYGIASISFNELSRQVDETLKDFRVSEEVYVEAINKIRSGGKTYDTTFLEFDIQGGSLDLVVAYNTKQISLERFIDFVFGYNKRISEIKQIISPLENIDKDLVEIQQQINELCNRIIDMFSEAVNYATKLYANANRFDLMDMPGKNEETRKFNDMLKSGSINYDEYKKMNQDQTIRREAAMVNIVENNFVAKNLKNALIICGSNHVDILKQKLESMDYEVEILSKVTPELEQRAMAAISKPVLQKEQISKPTQPQPRHVQPQPRPMQPQTTPTQHQPRPVQPHEKKMETRPARHFYRALEHEMRHGKSLSKMQTVLHDEVYNNLIKNNVSVETATIIAKNIKDKVNLRDFIELYKELEPKHAAVTVNGILERPETIAHFIEIFIWLRRHGKIDEKHLPYFRKK